MDCRKFFEIFRCLPNVPYVDVQKPANDEIWYASTDGSVVSVNASKLFGDIDAKLPLEVVSNTYTNGLGIIKLSGELLRIDGSAFANKLNLQSVALPESVVAVYNNTFGGCAALESVRLGANVGSAFVTHGIFGISGSVFKDCSALLAIVCAAATPPPLPKGTSAFSGVNPNCAVVAPMRSIADYSAADEWRKFHTVPMCTTDTTRVETRSGITYLVAGYGKDLFCAFNGMNYGMTATLGYTWYDKDGHELLEPHMLTVDDFVEIAHAEPATDEPQTDLEGGEE